MRLVLDTNVVVSALLWGGPPQRRLQAARENRVTLFTSMPLLAELTDILGRRKFEKKIEAAMLSIDQIVDRYGELTSIVRPLPVSGIAPDPDDDVVIGTALAAKAGWIVTGDQPLLSVVMHQSTRKWARLNFFGQECIGNEPRPFSPFCPRTLVLDTCTARRGKPPAARVLSRGHGAHHRITYRHVIWRCHEL